MPIHDADIDRNDDHEWEGYLKQFQPVISGPLPRQKFVKLHRPTITRVIWAGAVAIVLIAAALMLDYKFRPKRIVADKLLGTQTQPLMSLTIGQANHLLAESSSVEDALNAMVSSAQIPLPQGANSALATLGKEKFKL
jgi:hypothetical protein